MSETCGTCAHFVPEAKSPPFGSCVRWHQGYGVQLEDVACNEVLVENDEGWGMIMGPDFGCVLHAARPNAATS